jgi:hypothetical protein
MGGYASETSTGKLSYGRSHVLEIAARAGFDRLFVFGHAR